ncbi:diaminobutyrate acetyltransferase [Arcobacter sp.]|uniref:diaminobutyrate acetyltransferase n=1 Tax=unclassified Arcobacter TaxID=2593671 RepID=UPI003AFF6FFB
MSSYNIMIRKPEKSDAIQIYDLVKESKVLDLNSEYLYLLQSTHFSSTCAVALHEEKVIGFVSGYLKPDENNSLFIWQVAVDGKYRGNDIAGRLIMNIIKRDFLDVEKIYTTVSPSNISSIKVFEKVAKGLNTKMTSSTFFEKNDFKNSHEDETLYEIGPFKIKEEK